MKKLPIGIQSITKILNRGEFVYADKTEFVRKLIEDGSPHYFMSRPRRFGKSLFIDTVGEILSGNKELFKDCQIYRSNYVWKQYPVLNFDFSQIANKTPKLLEISLKEAIQDVARLYGESVSGVTSQSQLNRLITALSKQGRVVVLVDEYDKPIIDRLDDLNVVKENRDILKGFFGTLKSLDKYLKFTFITGVSKFSQVSLFSGPNNLRDITMHPEYAGMMGYTEEELRTCFAERIPLIAQERSRLGRHVSTEDVLDELRQWYDGYRFSESEECVYNPFSTLNFMEDKTPQAYWYRSGTPSFLIEQIKKHPQSMVSLDGTEATQDELMDISNLEQVDLKALMYQTGYFTIKHYDPISKRYHLGFPNEEVRTSFIHSLVKNFASIIDVRTSKSFVDALENYQVAPLFEHIERGLASFAYQVFVGAKEKTYQGMLLSILYGMGFKPLSEVPLGKGRIDVLLEMSKITYIIELKLDNTADRALEQIQEKKYFLPFTHKGKEIVIVGANFSSKTRNISDWKGELLSESGKLIQSLLPSASLIHS